jgi:hypothetical protein
MRVKTGDILICPYTDCLFSAAADHSFKRAEGYVSIFVCPQCKRNFLAFIDKQGETKYYIPKQATNKNASKKRAERLHK